MLQTRGGLAVMGQPVAAQRLRGYMARGRAVLAGGTITVVPGPAVTATDEVLIADSIHGGTPASRFISVLNVGAAGVGSFTVLSENALDTSTVCWGLFSNLFLG